MSLPVGSIAKCKHLFESQHPAELGLRGGDLVQVLEADRDGWTYCSLTSDPERKGCAPTNFLELVSSSAPQSAEGDAGNNNNKSASTPNGSVQTPVEGRNTSTSRAIPANTSNNNNNNSGTGGASNSAAGGGRATPTATAATPSYYNNSMALTQASNSAAANVSSVIRSSSQQPAPDAAALMEGFHKNELYFQQLLSQRQESNAALDSALREAATEIDLAKEKHASMTRRLKELDHMVSKERKRWKDRVEEERMLLAQRAGVAPPQSQQQQQQQQQSRGGGPQQQDRLVPGQPGYARQLR